MTNIEHVGIAAEIANFMVWNHSATIVLWVDHARETAGFRDAIGDFLKRPVLLPAHGELPPPRFVRDLRTEIGLDNDARLFIRPVSNMCKGLSITRAYVPRRVTNAAVLDELLTGMAPTIIPGGQIIRY